MCHKLATPDCPELWDTSIGRLYTRLFVRYVRTPEYERDQVEHDLDRASALMMIRAGLPENFGVHPRGEPRKWMCLLNDLGGIEA